MRSKPTAEDLGRDLGADLALCAGFDGRLLASPSHRFHQAWDLPAGVHLSVTGPPTEVLWLRKEPHGPGQVEAHVLARCYGDESFPGLVTAALSGWPAAIRRALAAEAEVKRREGK